MIYEITWFVKYDSEKQSLTKALKRNIVKAKLSLKCSGVNA